MSPPSTDQPARAEPLAPAANKPAHDGRATGSTHAPPHPTHPPHRLGVLRHFHFRNILFTQFFSNIGTWTEMFAIQMFVAKATGGLDDQGTLAVCQQLPIFVFGLFGGLAADRVNRRTLLAVTQLLAGVVAFGVWYVAHAYERGGFADARTAIHWLWALGVLNGIVMAFNFPAWQVLTPRLVPRDELTKAITLNGIQFNFARIVGPAIAGLVMAWWGGPPLLLFNACTFVVMAAVVMTTPDDPAPVRPRLEHERRIEQTRSTGRARARRALGSMFRELGEAWRFLMHNRGPRAVFLAQFCLCLLAAPMVRLLSNFVLAVYGLHGDVPPFWKQLGMKDMNELVGGSLLAMQGIGAVAGGIALKYVPPWYPKHHLVPVSVASLGLSITLFALMRSVVPGYIAMLIIGWFWMWAFNQSWACIQYLTPDHLRGRAMSITNVAVFGAMAAGAFVAGMGGEFLKDHHFLSTASATQASILMLSVPLSLAGIYMMINRVPEIDGMPSLGRTRIARSIFHAVTAREHWPDRGNRSKGPMVEALSEQEPV